MPSVIDSPWPQPLSLLLGLPTNNSVYTVYRNGDAWVKYIRDLTTHGRDVLEYATGRKAQLDASPMTKATGVPPSPSRTEQSEADLQVAGQVLVDGITIYAASSENRGYVSLPTYMPSVADLTFRSNAIVIMAEESAPFTINMYVLLAISSLASCCFNSLVTRPRKVGETTQGSYYCQGAQRKRRV